MNVTRRWAHRIVNPIAVIGRWPRDHWQDILLSVASIAVTYVLMDVGYRVYKYQTLPSRLVALIDRSNPPGLDSEESLFVFDSHTGYRYRPNFVGSRGAPWFSHWRTNSHGHVSTFEYPVEKPPGEFRIAVVGDSFTADITNNVRWTELLEEHLNASEAWRNFVAGKSTRVINFGVDGMGMVQFGAMVRYHAMTFEPDLVIVNFIADDLFRRTRYLSAPSVPREQIIDMFIKTNVINQIAWFRVYPELIAATVGKSWGMKAQLPLDDRAILAWASSPRYERDDAIRASAAAVEDILSLSPNAIFLQDPLFHEMTNEPNKEWIGALEDLEKAAPGLHVISMRPSMEALLEGKQLKDRPDLAGLSLFQLMALPESQRPEIYRWFYLPDDVHYNDYGTTVYARQVADVLLEKLIGNGK